FELKQYENTIVLICYCFDIRNGKKDVEAILSDILNSDNIDEELDYINGRYNFIIQKGEEINIFSDASQLRPFVYHENSKILASHDSLLKDILNEFEIEVKSRTPGFHTVLDFTRFDDIYKFNLSLYLHYNDFKFTRFY